MKDSEINEMTRRQINKHFRDMDESKKWPISGRFNATNRAIRKTNKLFPGLQGLEYYLAIDAEITRIVNAEV